MRLEYQKTIMTPTTQFAELNERHQDAKIVGLLSIAHFVSHYYFYILPPLFLLVRGEFNVSYVELGVALAVFHGFSAVLQTPAGFLIDRISASAVLIGGLAMGGIAFIAAGMTASFYVFVAMFAIAGIANTVYHPADYSIMSRRVSPTHMSKAFSVHIFAGYVGTAVTPACQIMLADAIGWRGAFAVHRPDPAPSAPRSGTSSARPARSTHPHLGPSSAAPAGRSAWRS